MTPKRTAVLISGRGSNMAALIEAARDPDYPAEIVGVLSSNPQAPGLGIARAAAIDTAVVERRAFPDATATDAAVSARLEAWGAEIVCLAGYMRILGPEFCRRWHGRLINIHPSLLPALKGLDTHRRALEENLSEHGCTVHFVTAELDAGPIIGQVVVPVEPDDTPDSLAARVLKAEHKLYPLALARLALGQVTA